MLLIDSYHTCYWVILYSYKPHKVQYTYLYYLCVVICYKIPSRRGRCSNLSPAIDCPDAVAAGVGGRTSSRDDNGSGCDTGINNSVTVINERFQCAFGASLLYSEGDCYDDSWCKLWLRLVAFKNCHYDLPNGAFGKDFVASLSSEIDLLAQGSVRSERVLVFLSAML